LHLTGEELELYADRRTSPAKDLSFAAHIAACRQCKDRLLAAELDGNHAPPAIASERRLNPRIPLHEPASMTRLNPLMTERWPIHLLDVSKGGLRLHVPNLLEPGTIVQIRLRAALVTAEVRYCIGAGVEFQAGVRTLDVFFLGGRS
jgi:hypothetical protein